MPLLRLNRSLMLEPFETAVDLPDREAVAAHERLQWERLAQRLAVDRSRHRSHA